MLKFRKFPRAAYRDHRYQRWAARFDHRLFACDFMEFLQGESIAVVMPEKFHDKYAQEFAGLRPGLSFGGNQFRFLAASQGITNESQVSSLTPIQLEATIRRLYEQWLAEEAEDLLKRTEAIGLHINSRSVQRLKSQIEGVAA